MPSKYLKPGTDLYVEGELVSFIAVTHDEARAYWLEAINSEDGIYDFDGPIRVHSEWLAARPITQRMIDDGEVDDDEFSGSFTTVRVAEGARGAALAWSLGPPHIDWSYGPVRWSEDGQHFRGVLADGSTAYDAKCNGQTFRGTEKQCSEWVREQTATHDAAWIEAYDAEHPLLLPASPVRMEDDHGR